MASSLAEGPSPESRQQQFEQGVAISLHLWQSLTIAVQNHWGGPDSSDKRDWLAGVVVDMFPSFVDLAAAESAATSTPTSSTGNNSAAQNSTKAGKLPEEPIAEEIEETLLQVMFDEFEANVDDQSEAEVADRIMKCRTQCAAGNFTLVEELRARWLDAKGKKIVAQVAVDPDQETDSESGSDDDEDDDGNNDVDMGDAPALVPVAPREKSQPEIDEDGFETVSRRRR